MTYGLRELMHTLAHKKIVHIDQQKKMKLLDSIIITTYLRTYFINIHTDTYILHLIYSSKHYFCTADNIEFLAARVCHAPLTTPVLSSNYEIDKTNLGIRKKNLKIVVCKYIILIM